MKNAAESLLMLLVQRSNGESERDFLEYMQERYDGRLEDALWGPLYRVGSTFQFEGQNFSQIQTLAETLLMRIVFDARKATFGRPVMYRFDAAERFRLVNPGGWESEVDESELVPIESGVLSTRGHREHRGESLLNEVREVGKRNIEHRTSNIQRRMD